MAPSVIIFYFALVILFFKIPQTALQEVYVTAPYVWQVVNSGLRGFVFRLIWTDEDYLSQCPYCSGIITEDTRDAPLEITFEEAAETPHKPCPLCGSWIPYWADPCPYCKQGAQRQGSRDQVAILCMER